MEGSTALNKTSDQSAKQPIEGGLDLFYKDRLRSPQPAEVQTYSSRTAIISLVCLPKAPNLPNSGLGAN